MISPSTASTRTPAANATNRNARSATNPGGRAPPTRGGDSVGAGSRTCVMPPDSSAGGAGSRGGRRSSHGSPASGQVEGRVGGVSRPSTLTELAGRDRVDLGHGLLDPGLRDGGV